MRILAGEQLPAGIILAYKEYQFEVLTNVLYLLDDCELIKTKNILSENITLAPLAKTIRVQLDINSVHNARLETSGGKIKRWSIEKKCTSYTIKRENKRIIKITNGNKAVAVPFENLIKREDGKFEYLAGKYGNELKPEADKLGFISAEQREELEMFCNYMYGLDDYQMVTCLDIDNKKSIGLNLSNLNSNWLSDSVIQNCENWFSELTEYQQRNTIIVLLFLQYLKETEIYFNNMKETGGNDINNYGNTRCGFKRDLIELFPGYIGEHLELYRFDDLYLGYPMDCLLLYLLSRCEYEDICDTLRVIYKTQLLEQVRNEIKGGAK